MSDLGPDGPGVAGLREEPTPPPSPTPPINPDQDYWVIRIRKPWRQSSTGKSWFQPAFNVIVAASLCWLGVKDGCAPLPPVPPGPNPPGPNPPGPVSIKVIQDAYAQDTDSDKAQSAAKLAAVYRQAADDFAGRASFTTLSAVDSAIRDAAVDQIGAVAITKTRLAIGTYLRAMLPVSPAQPLDDAMRQKARSAFDAVSKALGGLK
jgi:hypothetical protein